MIRVVLVDDEPPARRKLRRLLSTESEFRIVGEAGSGAEAVDELGQKDADLVFLDIQLPDCTGFDVLASLQQPTRLHIVFVTAHDEFALKAFDVHAVDYLLKPVEPSRFAQSLDRIRSRVQASGILDPQRDLSALPDAMRSALGFKQRILVREKGRSLFLDPDRVNWIESARNYICIYTDEETHVIRDSLETLESKLDGKSFRRISRSEIVNVNRIAEIRSLDHGDRQVTLTTGKVLRWTRRFRNEDL